ncbi:hypothetical protein ANCDUO_18860 [Ancylostoma duodenale]|uniref:Uncharacterized protein n=1 Tax=Ancylostoma duodenale TaxID=51022 RepID=A0A0C2G1X2_9BILA|nr:hypothetical protein ANCDUO_18860 [Ancylostoma duodenale]
MEFLICLSYVTYVKTSIHRAVMNTSSAINLMRPHTANFLGVGVIIHRLIIPDELTCDTSLTKCLQSRQPFIGASLGWSIETEKLGSQKQYVAVCDYCARDFTLGRVSSIFDAS